MPIASGSFRSRVAVVPKFDSLAAPTIDEGCRSRHPEGGAEAVRLSCLDVATQKPWLCAFGRHFPAIPVPICNARSIYALRHRDGAKEAGRSPVLAAWAATGSLADFAVVLETGLAALAAKPPRLVPGHLVHNVGH